MELVLLNPMKPLNTIKKEKVEKKKVKAFAIITEGKFNVMQIFRTKRMAKINTLKDVLGWAETREEIIPCEIHYSLPLKNKK